MELPKTRYARSGDTHIAYQVFGDGPIDLLHVPTWISQIEVLWEEPRVVRFFERLASFSRLILFDRRGAGLSDPLLACAPTLEAQMDDVVAVLDAAGSERAALFAQYEGGAMAMLFAATHPARTTALTLYSTFARSLQSEDTPWANSPEVREELVDGIVAEWGEGTRLAMFAPSLCGDERLRQWLGKLERHSASPGVIRAHMDLVGQVDVRAVLPSIRVPTLVMHRRDDPVFDPRHAEYIAARVPNARRVELPPGDSLALLSDNDLIADEVEEFITGMRPRRAPDRVLATVMFTDIVDSTRRAAELGDHDWRELLARHDQLVRDQLSRHDGREVKTMGDGFLATFDGPARAIRCAVGIREAVGDLGMKVRAGLHTGEVEILDGDVAGMAVNIGARVGASAGPDEVLVSSTVKDLVVGSGIEFAERGEQELKGVPGEWRLFAVEG